MASRKKMKDTHDLILGEMWNVNRGSLDELVEWLLLLLLLFKQIGMRKCHSCWIHCSHVSVRPRYFSFRFYVIEGNSPIFCGCLRSMWVWMISIKCEQRWTKPSSILVASTGPRCDYRTPCRGPGLSSQICRRLSTLSVCFTLHENVDNFLLLVVLFLVFSRFFSLFIISLVVGLSVCWLHTHARTDQFHSRILFDFFGFL